MNQYALWDLVESLTDASQWQTVRYELGTGLLADLQPANLLGRIFSPKAVEVLSPFAADVLWLPVQLRRDTKTYDYRYMHFLRRPDVLDEARSLIVNGKAVKPCVAVTKAADVPLICLDPLGLSVIVRGDVRDAVTAAKLQGVEFQKVATS